MTEPATKYAKSGHVHIAYQVSGNGPHDLLLVPDGVVPIESMPEEPALDRFIRRLGRFSRVIRFDRRGMGLSDPVSPVSRPTLEQWLADAEAVLDAIGSDQTALVGMAEGGFVAALMAAMKPQRVASLTLINATAAFTAEPFRHWGVAATTIERLGEFVGGDWGQVSWAIPLFAPSAATDQRYHDWLARATQRALSPAMAGAVFDSMFRSDLRTILPVIRVPTLVIHRAGNRYLTTEHGRYLAEHIPEARYVEVPGDDHVPYLGDSRPILDEVEAFVTGLRPVPEADRVLATVVFADLVGSTEKAAMLRDRRWRDLLANYLEVVRRTLREFGGRELDTAGDGVFATFDGPARAVRFAGSLIQAARPLDLDVRAGIHTGECEILGSKLGGIAVHIGARISALAGVGEVLVSGTVKDLVAGSGIRFTDRGLHTLKGIPDQWRIFAAEVDPLLRPD